MGLPVLRLARSIFWALTWGLGVAVGVAAGGWLTVVGGTGAPGAGSLDIVQDVFVLPSAAGGAVFALHLAGQAVIALIRRLARPQAG
ncbi:MAG: hypothetical protein CVT60_04820 [Actinobacteria bacterium HGW-Actinobacteria-10]|jgi:hypothetical protein|nr:MAG: hypothetical protein CVT60_04820 [Actinobacteria bacterium HGW-Actinobacteria-10]